MAETGIKRLIPASPLPPSPEEAERFSKLTAEELTGGRAGEGIGTLNEKRMHRILKRFACDRPECFERDMGARFVADIFDGEKIYEIQTGSLLPLGKKLDYYIGSTDYPITVIHPVLAKKYILWIDPADGCVSGRKPSPKKENTFSVLTELVYISEQLKSERLEVVLLFTEAEEYRFLNGKRSKDRKRGSDRFEILPVSLLGKAVLRSPADVASLLPEGLPSSFTAPEFGRLSGLRGRDVYRAVKALELLGIAVKSGTSGRAALYTLSQEYLAGQ
ncbi:MAG: hypothetical protein MJ137_06590 [Clostridia bacterium]|nr:hypothetical protein [Clostridia bacterium]